jgi:hypothetical protein
LDRIALKCSGINENAAATIDDCTVPVRDAARVCESSNIVCDRARIYHEALIHDRAARVSDGASVRDHAF